MRDETSKLIKNHLVAQNESIMKSQAIDRKQWVYTGDYRNDSENCKNHAKMNGKIIPKGEPFELMGLDGITYHPMYPHDSILPESERIGCKCTLKGIVRDDVLGLSLEERRRLQAKAIAEDDEDWEAELDAKNKVRAGIF